MCARGEEDGGVGFGQVLNWGQGAEFGADCDHAVDATVSRSRQKVIDFAFKLREIKVAMAVGERDVWTGRRHGADIGALT